MVRRGKGRCRVRGVRSSGGDTTGERNRATERVRRSVGRCGERLTAARRERLWRYTCEPTWRCYRTIDNRFDHDKASVNKKRRNRATALKEEKSSR